MYLPIRALINFLFSEAYCRKFTGSFLSITNDTSYNDSLEIALLKQLWASLQLENADDLQAQAWFLVFQLRTIKIVHFCLIITLGFFSFMIV